MQYIQISMLALVLVSCEKEEQGGITNRSVEHVAEPAQDASSGIYASSSSLTSSAALVQHMSLSKDIIQRHLRQKIPHVRYCYERELLKHPNLTGTVRTEFTISATGKATKISANGVSANVSGCVANVLKLIQFPRTPDGEPMLVRYPFTFSTN